jgi:hypothetical protein
MATNAYEDLANWFFRLNGCLTIPNFVVHPEVGSEQRTDADLLAVRFPHRCEMLSKPLEDHPLFTAEKVRLQVSFVEVKSGDCAINIPWKDPMRRNVNTVVSALGFAPMGAVNRIADSIYSTGQYSDETVIARFVCVGERRGNFDPSFADVPQILYTEIFDFIHRRFRDNGKAKSSHPQWDSFGLTLYDYANKYGKPAEFRNEFLNVMQTVN